MQHRAAFSLHPVPPLDLFLFFFVTFPVVNGYDLLIRLQNKSQLIWGRLSFRVIPTHNNLFNDTVKYKPVKLIQRILCFECMTQVAYAPVDAFLFQ